MFNLLGDIISNLSYDNTANITTLEKGSGGGSSGQTAIIMEEEQFQETMHFLLSFVGKEKQADILFERLLVRLIACETKRQRQYVSFCISELLISEKGVKKLIEQVK